MKRTPLLLSLFALILMTLGVAPAKAQSPDDEAQIRSAITSQAGAWNRADIDGSMKSYEDSNQTTFIGTNVRKGYQPIRQRYLDKYPTPEKMGRLSFSDIEIRLLPNGCGKADIALATGRYHVVTAGSAESSGVFSLVWRKGPKGWKIIMDHTS